MEKKEYYSLVELVNIVGLKYRQLQDRILKIYSKYQNNSDLLFKQKNRWFIHNTLLPEFQRIRKPLNYKIFATINSKNSFEKLYWEYVAKQLYKRIRRIDKKAMFLYVIEKTRGDVNHLHFITTYPNKVEIRSLIKQFYLTDCTNDMNVMVKDIFYEEGIFEYLSKQNDPVLLSSFPSLMGRIHNIIKQH